MQLLELPPAPAHPSSPLPASFPLTELSLFSTLVIWLVKTAVSHYNASDKEEREMLRSLIDDLRRTNQENIRANQENTKAIAQLAVQITRLTEKDA
jgi:hypothetical protein